MLMFWADIVHKTRIHVLVELWPECNVKNCLLLHPTHVGDGLGERADCPPNNK